MGDKPDLFTELDAAEDIVMGAEFPLTCQHCEHSPATHLLVADLHINGRGGNRGIRLCCKPCGDYSFRWKKASDHLWLYALSPVAETGED